MLKFTLNHTNNKARLGLLETKHSKITTPVFMPVGTKATVKGILPETLHNIGFEIILANTYHMMLTPGADIVEEQGGLHKFMNWGKSFLTDSGGFQVMSLSELSKIKDNGVEFRSHIDGSKHFMTPQSSVEIQHKLNSNITMVLDECTPYPATYEYAKKSANRTTEWAKLSKNAFIDRDGFGIFAINQGSMFEDLRKQSAEELMEIGFDGYAIGGLAIGEPVEKMLEVINFVEPLLPKNKPRYLMGVGRPSDIVQAIELGVDMFDCVLPTRMGRNGRAFTSNGEVNIRNAKHKTSLEPLDKNCKCSACLNYTKGYLHHLFKTAEMLGGILLTTHNLYFYNDFIKQSRNAILNNSFKDFKIKFLSSLNNLDND